MFVWTLFVALAARRPLEGCQSLNSDDGSGDAGSAVLLPGSHNWLSSCISKHKDCWCLTDSDDPKLVQANTVRHETNTFMWQQ